MALHHRVSVIINQGTSQTPITGFFSAVGNATTPALGAAPAGSPGANWLVIDSLAGSASVTGAAGNVTLAFEDGAGVSTSRFIIGCPTAAIAVPFSFADLTNGVVRIPLSTFTQSPELNVIFSATGGLDLTCVWHLE